MPISMHLENPTPSPGARVLTEQIGCDSGSFVFLPLSAKLTPSVRSEAKKALRGNGAVGLRLPAGRWTAYYEQFEPPEANMVGLYRNIVLKHTPIAETP